MPENHLHECSFDSPKIYKTENRLSEYHWPEYHSPEPHLPKPHLPEPYLPEWSFTRKSLIGNSMVQK